MTDQRAAGEGGKKTTLKLKRLLKEIDSEEVVCPKNPDVGALVWDSRQVVHGSIFFAVRGEFFDGNEYIEDAFRRGAVAVVTDNRNSLCESRTTIVVKDVRIALAKMAITFYGKPDQNLHLIGVTGTNGKTTVSNIIKYLLDDENDRCGLIGTINYVVGKRVIPSHKTTPEVDEVCALLSEMIEVGCESAVMEVSSHGVDQNRVHGLAIDTMAFLNLTRDHLDYHGTMDDYYSVKAKVFKGDGNPLPANAVINIDESYGLRLCEEIGDVVRCITFSCRGHADFSAQDIRVTESGSEFTLSSPEGRYLVHSPLLGRFNVSNVLAGMACAYAAGKSVKQMVAMIVALPSIPGRIELIDEGQKFLTIVDYAHTHDALDNLLHTIRSLSNGKLIVVFGCGGDRDREKRPMMMEIVCRYADEVWATSDNPRTEDQQQIFDDMLAGMNGHTRVSFIADRGEAIRKAIGSADEGDAVVIAGKGHEAFQILNDTIVPFDDRLFSRATLREINSIEHMNLGHK